MKYQHKIEKTVMCPIEYGLDIFGGKWKARIICVLSSKPFMRYSELRKELNNITDAVLASMLKELIKDRIISRLQYNEIPPHVEYSLTEEGKSVIPILKEICRWSRKNTKGTIDEALPSCRTCPELNYEI